MKEIIFEAVYGNDKKLVKILSTSGGAAGYQIYIDNYYQGDIVYRNGEWIAHLNAKSDLTVDDIQILGELIEQQNGR